MRPAVRVYSLLILAPLLLGALIFAAALFSGVSVSDWSPASIARFSALFPYVLGINHILLFALTIVAMKADRLSLSEIGWGRSAVGKPEIRLRVPIELLIGIGAGLVLVLMSRFLTGPLVLAAALSFADIGRLPIVFDNSPAWLGAVTFFAGVTHETLYRGYALRVLSERNGVVRAVIVSSIFFALFHWPQGLLAVISIVPDGIFLCLLALWRRNLWAPLAAHAGFNLASLQPVF